MLPIQRRQAILVGYYPHEVTTRRTIIAHSGASYVLGRFEQARHRPRCTGSAR